MNRFSCLATSVPSAPRAEPEKVRKVSCLEEVRAQAARIPRMRTISKRLTRYPTDRCRDLRQGRPPSLHVEAGFPGRPPRGYNLPCADPSSRDGIGPTRLASRRHRLMTHLTPIDYILMLIYFAVVL